MIVRAVGGVDRATVSQWLAEDIERGVVERVTPDFYRMRQRGCGDGRPRERQGRQ
jgi:hypothetical protein